MRGNLALPSTRDGDDQPPFRRIVPTGRISGPGGYQPHGLCPLACKGFVVATPVRHGMNSGCPAAANPPTVQAAAGSRHR
jgi:hypothetical protein